MDSLEVNPQIIFSWSAPLRPYKKRPSFILRFYLAVAFLLGSIIFFFGDKVLLIPIGALLFLFYVLTITPPPEVENKITAFGLDAAGVTLRWEGLSHFYYKKRFGLDVLVVVGRAPYFYHAYLVIPNEETLKKTKRILSERLMYQDKPQKKITDKMIDWLTALIPDEEESQVGERAPQVIPLSPQKGVPMP